MEVGLHKQIIPGKWEDASHPRLTNTGFFQSVIKGCSGGWNGSEVTGLEDRLWDLLSRFIKPLKTILKAIKRETPPAPLWPGFLSGFPGIAPFLWLVRSSEE